MVKVVSVAPRKKKDILSVEDERKELGLDYIKSLKDKTADKGLADWAKPKKVKKEEFGRVDLGGPKKVEVLRDVKSSAADWAVPKKVIREDFGPTGLDDEGVIKKGTMKKIPVQSEQGRPDWASPKSATKEYFGPTGLGVEAVDEAPKKVFTQIKTGVKGLDNILEGGIPTGNLITVSGGPGSGKTIMCLQFIYAGAKKFNEPGVFVSLEEDPERLIKTAQGFGWNFNEMIKKNKIILIKTPLYKFEVLKNIIRDSVYKIKAKRLVIDPGALFELFFEREIEVRKAIVELGDMLKKLGCTTIITTEENGQFNQGNFSSDGIIFTYHTKLSNQFMRMIAIIKMRGTSHSEKIHPLRFTKKGLEVLSEEEVFQDVVTPNF